jgi:hypothetical protein
MAILMIRAIVSTCFNVGNIALIAGIGKMTSPDGYKFMITELPAGYV